MGFIVSGVYVISNSWVTESKICGLENNTTCPNVVDVGKQGAWRNDDDMMIAFVLLGLRAEQGRALDIASQDMDYECDWTGCGCCYRFYQR